MWGGGSVGLGLAARLAAGGVRVCVVTRRAEQAERLRAGGLCAEDPERGGERRLRVDATDALPDAAAREAAVLFACLDNRGLAAGAGTLAGAWPDARPVCFQNDVVGEERLAAAGLAPLGGVWRDTCTRVADDRVRLLLGRPGRAIVGCWPTGVDAAVEAAARLLRAGGIDVGISSDVRADKWLKLCINTTSAVNALVRQADHARPAFVELKLRLLGEARAALAAAGVEARSCDGRDRSLEEEIAHHQSSLARGVSARRLPLYNDVHTALARGERPEALDYHDRITALGERCGTPTPTQRRVRAALERAFREALGPECYGAEELLGA